MSSYISLAVSIALFLTDSIVGGFLIEVRSLILSYEDVITSSPTPTDMVPFGTVIYFQITDYSSMKNTPMQKSDFSEIDYGLFAPLTDFLLTSPMELLDLRRAVIGVGHQDVKDMGNLEYYKGKLFERYVQGRILEFSQKSYGKVSPARLESTSLYKCENGDYGNITIRDGLGNNTEIDGLHDYKGKTKVILEATLSASKGKFLSKKSAVDILTGSASYFLKVRPVKGDEVMGLYSASEYHRKILIGRPTPLYELIGEMREDILQSQSK